MKKWLDGSPVNFCTHCSSSIRYLISLKHFFFFFQENWDEDIDDVEELEESEEEHDQENLRDEKSDDEG